MKGGHIVAVVIAVIVVAGAVGLAACSGSSSHSSASPPPARYLVCTVPIDGGRDCFHAAQPAEMVITPADAANQIIHIKWSDWGKAEATGTGEQWSDNCDPDCASGTFHSYGTATVTASDPVNVHGTEYYNRVTVDLPVDTGTLAPNHGPVHATFAGLAP